MFAAPLPPVLSRLESAVKPKDASETRRMLEDLQGHTHEVATGVYLMLASPKKFLPSGQKSRFVRCRPEEIAHYHSKINPPDKADTYAIHVGS